MRIFMVVVSLLFAIQVSAATLEVTVARNGFEGPIEIALAPRVEGQPPEWSATKTIAAEASAATFDVGPGLYTVLARGPQPLQRLSAKANAGNNGGTARLTIPKTKTAVRVTLAGEPVPRAAVAFIHDELRWHTELTTGEDGRFAGALWEPGKYNASIRREGSSAPHVTDVDLSAEALRIDVPDRHITGRVTGDDGKPLGGALIALRTEGEGRALTMRAQSAPDGRFELFGVGEGEHSLYVRAPSYLQSDTAGFELYGVASRSVDFKLTRGTQRDVRVIDARGTGVANAALFTACDGHVKSTTSTNAEGRAKVSVPESGPCAVYAVPKEGSLGMAQVAGSQPLTIRVPGGSSSLNLTLKTEGGDAFADTWLLMRIDGVIVPPAVARQLTSRGLSLITNSEGRIALNRIPPGTYEFWPYRTSKEGEMLYDVASSFAAPIAVNVVTGENDATVKFRARR